MHYTFEQLAAYIRGSLPQEESDSIAEHIEGGCEMCAGRLSILEKLKASFEMPEFVSPAEELTDAVRNIFSTDNFGKRAARSVRELTASLIYDSYLKPAHATLRSMGVEERQVLLRAGDYEIDYRITKSEGRKRFILTGQLLTRSKPDLPVNRFSVYLKPRQGKTLMSPVSELGEFEFPNVRPARYRMYVGSESMKINLGLIDLA